MNYKQLYREEAEHLLELFVAGDNFSYFNIETEYYYFIWCTDVHNSLWFIDIPKEQVCKFESYCIINNTWFYRITKQDITSKDILENNYMYLNTIRDTVVKKLKKDTEQ